MFQFHPDTAENGRQLDTTEFRNIIEAYRALMKNRTKPTFNSANHTICEQTTFHQYPQPFENVHKRNPL